MSILSEKWRSLGTVALAALTFNTTSAQGLALAQPQHPLLDDKVLPDRTSAVDYHVHLSNRIVAATSESDRSLGGAIAARLNRALANPSDSTRVVLAPEGALVGQTAGVAVVTAKGQEQENIPVCIDKDNTIKATLFITNAGKVVDDKWDGNRQGVMQANGKMRPACADYVIARRSALEAKSAALRGGDKQVSAPATASDR